MKLYIFYLFVIILTLSNFNNVFGVDLNQAEYNCLYSLANKYQDTTILNSLNIPSTFCSLGSTYGACDNGSVIDLTFKPTVNNVQITTDELKCLPFLASFSLVNGYASPSILQTNSYNTKLKKIKWSSYIAFNIDFEIGNLDTLEWGSFQTTLTSTITPFSLKNVKIFHSTSNVNLIPGTHSDYVNNYTTSFSGLSENMPDLTNMIKLNSVSMRSSSTFNETSFININGYSKIIKLISISSSTIMRFPYELANGVPRDTVNLSSDGLKAPPFLIDLSNIPYISTFQILKMGQDFNYQGNFPFSKLPLKCGYIQFYKGNTPNVDWQIFENVTGTMLQDLKIITPFPSSNPFSPSVTSFDVSQNQITGQVDESWCSVSLIVTKNLLTGKLPNCFYCYLNVQIVGNNFDQNNFDNYNITNNKCGYDIIVPYIYYNKTSTGMKLLGKNLGWVQTNFKTSTCVIVKSDGFIVVGCVGTYTNVTFVNQNLNFTLSLDLTEPIINNVIQTNNTFLINGSYFAYEPSIINVTIDGESPLKCEFKNSTIFPTFYSIQCDIEYPVIEYGLKNLRVQVNSLVSKPYQFNLDYTKFPCPVDDCNGNGICNDHIGVCECFKNWKTIGDDICSIAIHYLSSYTQISDIVDGGIINLYGFFGDIHNNYKVLIDGVQSPIEVAPTSEVFIISVGSGKIGKNSSIEIIQNGLSFHGIIYPYENLIKECPSNCNSNGKCNTTTGECTCKEGFIGVDCIKLTNYTLPTITSSISNVGLLFKSEQTVFITSLYSFIEVDYTGIIIKTVSISSWKTETINQGIKYIGSSSNSDGAIFEITFLKVPTNQQFSFAGNEFTIEEGGAKMSITVSNYTYSNQSNYLVVAMLAKAESDPSSPIQNKCNNGTIIITSQSNSNLTLNNFNYFTISKDAKRLSIRLQDKLISDGQPTFMINQLNTQLPDQSLLFGMSLPHCGKQCSIDGPDFIVNIESNYTILTSCSPKPTSTPKSSSEVQPSFSLKQNYLISFILIIFLNILLIILN
ncbi:hypothetical protein ACTFIY_011006 [Dictyostelium cf. discoideum]